MAEPARPPLPYAWPEVRARLQGNIDGLLARLFPGARAPSGGGPLFPLNPTRNDRRPGSFFIWRDGDRKGGWRDAATGEQGDVFQLIGYVERLQAPIDCYWWALEFLGLDRKGDASRPRTKAADLAEREARARQAIADAAKAEAAAEEKAGALLKRWLALPSFVGTVGEAYLREARGIDLSRLARAPEAIRFSAAEEHFDAETGEITAWPCLVSAMTRGSKLVGLHRTYLAADGSGKAPVATAKKMLGSVRGSAIRLARGPSGLSPAEAQRRIEADRLAAEGRGVLGPLAIGEGIETSLTVAAARPDYRVWAAGSLSLMGLLDWPGCASAVVLLQDNDWKPEARSAFAQVEAHWRAQAAGRRVVVVASAVGSDFNDAVRKQT